MTKRWLIGLFSVAMAGWLLGPGLAEAQPHGGKGPRKGGPGAHRGDQGPRKGGPGGPRGGPGAQRPEPGQIFGHLDKNQDGKVTKEELPGRVQEHFSKVDSNGDGAISKEEFIEAHKKMRGQGPGGPGRRGPDPEQMFKHLDKNTDGKLTEKEVPKQAWERIGKADADGNGEVTKEELKAMIKKHMEQRQGEGPRGPGQGPRDHGQMFQRFDKNTDGKLTKDEVPEQLWERFTNAGMVQDGAVTKEALKKAMQKRMQNRKGPRGKKAE